MLAISNRSLCERPFLEQIERVCKLRPDALVLREKDLSPQEYKELAEQVLRNSAGNIRFPAFCTVSGKRRWNWDGNQIHLPLHLLRGLDLEAKKKFRVIGTSIHAVEEAVEAQSLGATYLTAGHIYTTDCKGWHPADLSSCDKSVKAWNFRSLPSAGSNLTRSNGKKSGRQRQSEAVLCPG